MILKAFCRFLFLYSIISLCALGYAEPPPPLIKIGVIVPLSGDMAQHGIEVQRAMELAQSKLQSTHYAYKLIFEDNRLEGTRSISAAHRLIDVEKVDCVVTLWPPTALVVIPISERANVLHYTISWDPDLARNNRLVLSHQVMLSEIARATLELLKRQGVRRAAFLHMEESGFNIGADSLRRQAPGLGVEFPADESFDPNEKDFKGLIERVERKSPDGYLVWSVMPSIDLVIRQIRARKPHAFITGYLDYAQDASLLQGASYVSEMYATPDFTNRYLEKYQELPVSKGANAFDIFNLLVKTCEQSPQRRLSAAEMKAALVKTRDYSGAVGRFSIDNFGNSSYSPVIRKITGAERLLVE
jgi:ABC-type branched-subunit amino acid transport system substrate-binding protein